MKLVANAWSVALVETLRCQLRRGLPSWLRRFSLEPLNDAPAPPQLLGGA
jgi:hypothetical protein